MIKPNMTDAEKLSKLVSEREGLVTALLDLYENTGLIIDMHCKHTDTPPEEWQCMRDARAALEPFFEETVDD